MTEPMAMTEELFRQDSYLKTCEASVVAIDERGVRLDRTVFYPNGGGQPGDTGTLTTEDGTVLRVADTVKADGAIAHVLAPDQAAPAPGSKVTATVDWDRRYRHIEEGAENAVAHLATAMLFGESTWLPIRGGQLDLGTWQHVYLVELYEPRLRTVDVAVLGE